MKSEYVLSLYEELLDTGIPIWIDGGWAVDAHAGKQTREHEDLDIAANRKDLVKLLEHLQQRGFREVEVPEDKKWGFVLQNNDKYQVEIHAFETDADGILKEEPFWDGYTGTALNGIGMIHGHQVQCVTIEHLKKTKDAEKRKLKESDFKDLETLEKLEV